MAHAAQYVEPAVSHARFGAELAEYEQMRCEYEARGWLLVQASFPTVFVVMASPKLTPPAIVTGVLFDYSNYDNEPPSVRLVNPLTRIPYKQRELPTTLNRSMPGQAVQLPGMPAGANLQMQVAQPLMQAHEPEDIPFLCIAGVREYHEHPAHTGDAWELHRASGAGRLVRLLEVIHHYGVEPIQDYAIQLVPQIGGFQAGQPPE
jgi:hypothetical protein